MFDPLITRLRRLAWHIGIPTAVRLPEGRFRARSDVEYFRTAQYGGEQLIVKRFVDLVRPGDIVFDIGASVGLLTIAVARAHPDCRVYAFEPDPQTFSRLQEHIVLNGIQNARTTMYGAR